MSEKPQIQTVVRLSEAELHTLEGKLANPIVGGQTSILEAGFKLGVQATLKVLRDGYSHSA